MTDIPEDVLTAAEDIASLIPSRVSNINRTFAAQVIARAILAERDRCAKIAEEDCRTALAIEHRYKPTWYVRAQKIATAIRTPTEPQLNKVQP